MPSLLRVGTAYLAIVGGCTYRASWCGCGLRSNRTARSVGKEW
jgi:hypothetical protein